MLLKTALRKFLPRRMRAAAASSFYRAVDIADTLFGSSETLVPPRSMISVGDGDFVQIGNEFLGYFREFAELAPHHRVLDVGCGIGRMAVPLSGYLSTAGGYEGFDVVPHGIAWCRRKITRRYPHFRFQCVPVRNSDYNPAGRITAAEFRFPYPDDSFDIAVLTSVFTHMLPAEVSHYLGELARVLRPGGRSFSTWFLLNDESRALIASGGSKLDFRYRLEDCLVVNIANPGQAIAYDEQQMRAMHAACGLAVASPLQLGSWCGRGAFTTFQDICVARNESTGKPQ